MLGLLSYLPTTAYLPQFTFLLAFLYVLIRDRERLLEQFENFVKQPNHPINYNLIIILTIIILSAVNRLIHWDSVANASDIFPYFILLIPTYFIATGLNQKDVKVLSLLVTLEAIVVIIEYYLGVSTFDSSLSGFKEFGMDEAAYSSRPLGISASSSHIASKLFVAWLLLDFFKIRSVWSQLSRVFMLIAIVFTFNRSVMLSMGVYLVLSNLNSFLMMKYELEKAILGMLKAGIGLVGVVTVLVFKGGEIINQLTRNTGKVELTGREYIWMDFWKFIQEHLIFGNGSIKLWLDGYHAHNSYIEVIATNGVFIALVYFLLVARNIKRSNWFMVVPILVFGLTQYAFFWGVSLFDIAFWIILFGSANTTSKVLTKQVA